MKKIFLYPVFLLGCLAACKEKSKKSEEAKDPPISALSIIRGQLNHLDTSLYQLMKYEIREDGKTDTAYIKREDIRGYAKVFTDLPDIAETRYQKSYTEERLIDETQNALTITHTAKDEKQEIQKQILIVNLEDAESGNVQSIYFDRILSAGDSSVQQRLLWQIDRFFQAASITQKENQAEKVHTLRLTWQ
jgi:hypothetical protein